MAMPDSSLVTYNYDGSQRLVDKIDLMNRAGNQSTIFEAHFVLSPTGQRISASRDLPLDPTAEIEYERFAYQANSLTQWEELSFTYDGDGNMVMGRFGGPEISLQYDTQGHLIRCGNDTYGYDVDGYRVMTNIDGVLRQYVYDTLSDTPRILAEYDENGVLIARYVHGLDLISREDGAGQRSYYHSDARGSTVALTDDTGAITDSYAYGVWGAVLDHFGSSPQPFQFCGADGVMNDGNGLTFMRSRIMS